MNSTHDLNDKKTSCSLSQETKELGDQPQKVDSSFCSPLNIGIVSSFVGAFAWEIATNLISNIIWMIPNLAIVVLIVLVCCSIGFWTFVVHSSAHEDTQKF